MNVRMVSASAVLAGFVSLLVVSAPVARAEQGKLTIELNKLESQDKNCRAFFVVGNDTATEYQSLRLDLVLFQPDGIIGRKVAVDLAPLKASKKVVRLFDLEGLACDQIGSVLVNDVVECKATGAAAAGDCLSGTSFSSLAKAPLTTK